MFAWWGYWVLAIGYWSLFARPDERGPAKLLAGLAGLWQFNLQRIANSE
jgi:hypothetical protein